MIRRTFEYLSWFGNDRPFVVFFRVAPKTPLLSHTHTWEIGGKRWAPNTTVLRILWWGIGWGRWEPAPSGTIKVREADIAYAGYVAVNGFVDWDTWYPAWLEVKDLGLDPDDEMAAIYARHGILQ